VINPKRGCVYRMEDPEYGRLHCLALAVQSVPGMEDSFLALRVSVTGQRLDFPGWVRLTSGDPCAGYAVVHDIDRVDIEELAEELGPLSPVTMLAVEQQIKRMLGL
jgi:mRNA-degrading endonuclease toxin of MazEF toxin-antitoxin module